MSVKTIFDAYSNFEAANTKGNRLAVRSVIHRFLAESWGGEPPKGSKAISIEVTKFLELIKTLPATSLAGSIDLLEQKFIEKRVSKDNSKSYRSAYKVFFNWAETNGYFETQVENKIQSVAKVSVFNSRNPYGSGTKARSNNHGKTCKPAYTLMAKHNTGNENTGCLIFKDDYINDNLMKELNSFEKFRTENHNCAESTIETNKSFIYRFLGWLHRYKNVPLEKLSLTSIITFVQLNIPRSKFKDENGKINHQEYIYEKAMVKQDAIDIANENKKLIEEYLDFVDGHPSSKVMIIVTCIAVAKFIFRNEVGTDEYITEKQLPIIIKLNHFRSILKEKSKSAPPSVPHGDKSVPWLKAWNVLEILRARIHCLSNEYNDIRQTKKGEACYIKKSARDEEAIINNLQRFLILALMILIPTDRSRTYCELELNRTFVYGLYEDGRFTPINKLADKTHATWYIHLLPKDYKTGNTYKEYWGEIPNVLFDNDNSLYKYINKWIKEGRNFKKECNHNRLFRGAIKYKPLASPRLGSLIRTIFKQETGVPVTPKEIRKMYVTYLNNTGATDAEMKAAAYAMHHSKHMQENIYNSQTILERLRPIFERNEKMHKEFFGENSQYED